MAFLLSGPAGSRARCILIGAVCGLAWAASLRGFMSQLADLDSTFTFSGTFGVILPTGTAVGALLGWAEYQRRAGRQYQLLAVAPLLLAVVPLALPGAIQSLFSTGESGGPIGLGALGLVGGYAVSGRGPRRARIVAAIAALAAAAAPYAVPASNPLLSVTTARGAWLDTLVSSLYVTLALASAIPMLHPCAPAGRDQAATAEPPAAQAGTVVSERPLNRG